MGALGGLVGKGGVMITPSRVRVEGEVKLIFPPEFKPGLGQGIIPPL